MHAISEALWGFNTRDLMRASSCAHCTNLAIARTLGVPSVMQRLAPEIEKAQKAKENHTNKTLAMKYGDLFELNLQNELIESMGAEFVKRPEIDGDFAQTIELMKAGAPVIYQGGLKQTVGTLQFGGKPDFLVRGDYELTFVDGKLTAVANPEGSSAGYTVCDAKYAGKTKPTYLLQVAIYIDALAELGLLAKGQKHGTVLGKRVIDSYEEIEILPAMKLAREDLMQLVNAALLAQQNGDLAKYEADAISWHCAAKDACSICEYPDLCAEDRVATDDLVQVAGITQSQIAKLAAIGVTTMSALAESSNETFSKIQRQAAEQVKGLGTGNPEHTLLSDPEIQFLPPKSANDIFFDMEGFPYFIEGDGLEYLFGNTNWNDEFVEFWANDREEEKQAFIDFVTWAVAQMQADPGAHIYHYASYENSALVRLATRFGVMNDEVRWLQVNGRLVDLYPYVRNSLVVGEDGYSIKDLERHYGFKRSSATKNANASIEDYQNWRDYVAAANDADAPAEERAKAQALADETYRNLRQYNIEDVQSTRELYVWLASFEGACSRYGEDRENPYLTDPDGLEGDGLVTKAQLELERLQARTAELFEPVADWQFGLDAAADEKALVWLALTHSILFYKREDVMFWTDIYIRMQQDDAQLESDRRGAALLNLREVSRESKTKRDSGAPFIKVTYQAELPIEDLYEPEVEQRIVVRYEIGGRRQKRDFGEIISFENGTVTFTRESLNGLSNVKPNAILEAQTFNTSAKQSALELLANEITGEWGDPRNEAPVGRAIMDLLLRRAPRLTGGGSLPTADANNYLPAVIEATQKLDNSTLCIQGPPGSGKTYLASYTIANLVAKGFKVAVLSNSHSAVENLLQGCVTAGVDPAVILKAKKKFATAKNVWQEFNDTSQVVSARKKLTGGYIIGGTSFTFCNTKMREEQFDYMFIDEAAQFSLVDAIANSIAARNLILLGDPQQLAQVVMAVHPGGVSNSALGHYMGDHAILPKHMGYFVEVTRRLHPEINKPVSWLSYEGKLRAHESTREHFVDGLVPGITSVPVQHYNNVSRSDEEVAVVLDLTRNLTKTLPQEEILIVAAYNAQVDAIRNSLDAGGFTEVMVGTVDKFQGREGLVVIYSFAASSAADAPRGLEFLLERNRLNVAISRAKGHCYLVHSKDLLKSRFKTVEELKCVSRLAGILEFAN